MNLCTEQFQLKQSAAIEIGKETVAIKLIYLSLFADDLEFKKSKNKTKIRLKLKPSPVNGSVPSYDMIASLQCYSRLYSSKRETFPSTQLKIRWAGPQFQFYG